MFPSGKIGGRRELALMPWQNYGTDGIPERSMARIGKKKKNNKNEELFPVTNGRLTDTVSTDY